MEEPTPKAKDKDTPTASHTPDLTTPTSPLVSSSSGTTSKLLPRKRSSMSRPTLGKMKRKQQFTRLYSNEMYDRDEAPLLGMLPTSRSLTVEEVQQQINSILDSIAQVDTQTHASMGNCMQHHKASLIPRPPLVAFFHSCEKAAKKLRGEAWVRGYHKVQSYDISSYKLIRIRYKGWTLNNCCRCSGLQFCSCA